MKKVMFEEDKTENEQCLGALEQAIDVLTEKAFHKLMATKRAEQAILEATLEKQLHDEALKAKADTRMRAEEEFFEEDEWWEECLQGCDD